MSYSYRVLFALQSITQISYTFFFLFFSSINNDRSFLPDINVQFVIELWQNQSFETVYLNIVLLLQLVRL